MISELTFFAKPF